MSGEPAQRLSALAALAEHSEAALFWPALALCSCTQPTHKHELIHVI